MPHYVHFLAKHRPEALKTLRDRYEQALGDSQLPRQMIPLFKLHAGAIGRQRGTIRVAALEARRVGVTKAQLLETLCFAFLYTNEETMDIATSELEPILETWP